MYRAATFPHKALFRKIPVKKSMDTVNGWQMALNKRFIAKIHHMVVDHQQIINGKSRDHITLDGGGICVD